MLLAYGLVVKFAATISTVPPARGILPHLLLVDPIEKGSVRGQAPGGSHGGTNGQLGGHSAADGHFFDDPGVVLRMETSSHAKCSNIRRRGFHGQQFQLNPRPSEMQT
jgi:hypothetical protein